MKPFLGSLRSIAKWAAVFVAFSDTTAGIDIESRNPRLRILRGSDLTKEEAKLYLKTFPKSETSGNTHHQTVSKCVKEEKANYEIVPLTDESLDHIIATLGTRLLDLKSMKEALGDDLKDPEKVKTYLDTRLNHLVDGIDVTILSHPKLLDLLMQLSVAKDKKLGAAQMLIIMEATEFTTLKPLLKQTQLLSLLPEQNILIFNTTLCENAFAAWKKKESERHRERW